ncbi:unannotated protein [freshwater metagenome]|uniref:Unannotated protein n=1 Tax=freshwater metagenome TaxID=449393 RepID=A0A6J6Z4C2_9ZZZZ
MDCQWVALGIHGGMHLVVLPDAESVGAGQRRRAVMTDPIVLERLSGDRRLSHDDPSQAEALTGACLEVVLGAEEDR